MTKLKNILKEIYNIDIDNTYHLESEYAALNELNIDDLNTYTYTNVEYFPELNYTEAWQFEDRCGNILVAVYLKSTGEFKSGYKVNGVNSLVFDPKKLNNAYELIKPCADDKRINTIYKILVTEVIPKYLLNKKPNKRVFNPVSKSRSRLVSMIISKVLKKYPELINKNNYLVYM